jgi:hypothetical protein
MSDRSDIEQPYPDDMCSRAPTASPHRRRRRGAPEATHTAHVIPRSRPWQRQGGVPHHDVPHHRGAWRPRPPPSPRACRVSAARTARAWTRGGATGGPSPRGRPQGPLPSGDPPAPTPLAARRAGAPARRRGCGAGCAPRAPGWTRRGVPRGWGPAACHAAHGRRGPRRPGPGPARVGRRPRRPRHRLYGPRPAGAQRRPKAITTPPRAGGGHTPVASRTGADAHSPGPSGSSRPQRHRMSARLVHQVFAGR